MEEKTIEEKEAIAREDLSISWFGVDGALCLCFVLESIIIGYSMIHDVDIILGRVVPYAAVGITTWIFLKYISQVIFFANKSKKG